MDYFRRATLGNQCNPIGESLATKGIIYIMGEPHVDPMTVYSLRPPSPKLISWLSEFNNSTFAGKFLVRL